MLWGGLGRPWRVRAREGARRATGRARTRQGRGTAPLAEASSHTPRSGALPRSDPPLAPPNTPPPKLVTPQKKRRTQQPQ